MSQVGNPIIARVNNIRGVEVRCRRCEFPEVIIRRSKQIDSRRLHSNRSIHWYVCFENLPSIPFYLSGSPLVCIINLRREFAFLFLSLFLNFFVFHEIIYFTITPTYKAFRKCKIFRNDLLVLMIVNVICFEAVIQWEKEFSFYFAEKILVFIVKGFY